MPTPAPRSAAPAVPASRASTRSGASFALGATGRLLPLSIPLRFFGAAALFHLLGWVALGLGAQQVPRFAGGAGWPLAALHAVTLGVLAMSAIGASLQLMPVATLQPLGSRRAPLVVWWLYTPGVAMLWIAMAAQRPLWMALAAVPVIAALLVYGALLARNLAGARGMPGVRTMGWLALASLLLVLGSAAMMLATWVGWAAWPRNGLLMLHVVFAVFGFMGALALGFSNILVPMFALGPVPSDRTQLRVAACAVGALVLTVPVALDAWPRTALLPAIASGAAAVIGHLLSMRRVLRDGMRRQLGGSFQLVRAGWAALLATLALAAWWAFDDRTAGLVTAVIACAVLGWLASFLFGILQRIVPFLAAMHLAGTRRRAPTPSSLTDGRALTVHRVAHGVAVVTLAVGVALDHAFTVMLTAAIGSVGAIAFGFFLVVVLQRARHARAALNSDG